MGDSQTSGSNCNISQPGPPHRLHQAAHRGDVTEIQEILESLTEEEKIFLLSSEGGINGECPLHFAAAGGHMDALTLLIPEKLTNAQTRKGGLSALHLAAIHGYSTIAQWLVGSRGADLNLQDSDGCTPLHLSVFSGHKEVVRSLVSQGAELYILDKYDMFPASYCKDQSMFDALFSDFMSHSASFSKSRAVRLVDVEKRTILHYAAQYGKDPAVIARLITETDSDLVYAEDIHGDSFFHVAAKYGNMKVFEALEKAHVDMAHLVMNNDGGNDPLKNTGMCALLYDQREFFDELVARGNVKITLSCIIKGLIAVLIDKPEIKPRLALFGNTLPTYLALYAKKDCIFDFLLETDILSLSQWDDKHYRTCLHWAVVDKRTDIVQKLCSHVKSQDRDGKLKLWPGIQDGDGKTVQQHAFEQKNHMVMEILSEKRTFKEHEEKLNRDREVYVQALNAILVGAALIASVTFAGWLQMPFDADFKSLAMKIYWASNSMSFFTAVATMCVTTTALLPTPSRYVGVIVNQLRLAIVIDAVLLALSLAAVMWAFAAAGFAALRHVGIFTYQVIMRVTISVGGCICLIMWLAFVIQLFKSGPPKSVLFSLLPSLPFGWRPTWLQRLRAHFGYSSRLGYPNKQSSDLNKFMDEDLVAYHARQLNLISHAPPAPNTPCKDLEKLLSKLDIKDKKKFITDIYKQRKDKSSSTHNKGVSRKALLLHCKSAMCSRSSMPAAAE